MSASSLVDWLLAHLRRRPVFDGSSATPMKPRRAVPALLVVMAAATIAHGQAPPPQVPFRSGVSLVAVDVRVVGKQGRFVDDLKKEEIRLFEKGKEQVLTEMTMVDLPVNRGPRSPLPDEGAYDRGRVLVLFLDDLFTNPLRTETVKIIARKFLNDGMGADDSVAIVTSSRRGSTNLTRNRATLLAAVETFRGVRNLADPTAVERNARHMGETFERLCGVLPKFGGRRTAVIFVSEGWVSVPPRMIQAAQRNNVVIYPLSLFGDPRGKKGDIPPLDLTPPDVPRGAVDFSNPPGFQGLMRLAEDTGGTPLVGANTLQPFFDRIMEETGRYYLLGYEPSAQDADENGLYRPIEVRVNRPKVSIQSRKGVIR